jgi:hypothetical protein
MKAIRYHRYGAPEVLEIANVKVPAVGDAPHAHRLALL